MKVKVSKATNFQLDWLVAKAEGHELMLFDTLWRDNAALKGYPVPDVERHLQWQPQKGRHVIVELRQLQLDQRNLEHLTPTRCAADIPDYATDWAQGGPIIEREKIGWFWDSGNESWNGATPKGTYCEDGPTPLIAAMRCYVASKLGDEVEVPDTLI